MSLAERTPLLPLCLVLGICLGVSGAAPPDDFERGVRAYKQGAYQEARSQLRSVFAENPARVSHERGAVAYWLGKTYKACGQPDSVRWAWKRGTKALKEKDRFAARLFDARLWVEWSGASERSEAVDTYLSLLSHAGPNLNDRARPVLRRHVTQLLPVLPESQEKHVFRRSGESTDEFQLKKGAGPWLVSWWGSKDPLPATAVNERVEEHLRRVRHATDHFARDADLANFDARGDLYVRYGAPTDTHTIPFADLDFLREVMHLGVRVSPSDFPDNVIWKYPNVGERGSYLFVKGDEGYRLGTAMDLFPEELRRRYNASDRSQNRAYSSLAAMRYIYEHLAMHYQDPGNVYPKVTQYFNVQRARENSVLQDGMSEIGEGAGAREVYQGPGVPSPGEVANRNLRKAEQRDKVFIQRREKEMPQSRSSVATTGSTFPVQVRPVRYLEESGSTRVEVLWGSLQAGTEVPAGLQQITTSLVAYGQDYSRQGERTMRHRFSAETEEANAPLRTQATAITVDKDLYHLAMQWDRYDVQKQGPEVQLGEQTGRQSVRFDSLRALSSDPGRLEMSDLRPMVPSGSPFNAASPTEQAVPYPFSSLTLDTPLLLSFEVYHLQYAAQDRTEYEVAYEVERMGESGGFLGLFGGDETERTETASTYTGTRRRTSESILIDWGEMSADEAESVTITVRVTDETSGQTVERSIGFQVASPESQ